MVPGQHGFNDREGLIGRLTQTVGTSNVKVTSPTDEINFLLQETNCGVPGTFAYRVNEEIEESGCGTAGSSPVLSPFFGTELGGTVVQVENLPECLDDTTIEVYCRFAGNSREDIFPGLRVNRAAVECLSPYAGIPGSIEVAVAFHDPTTGNFDSSTAQWAPSNRYFQIIDQDPQVQSSSIAINPSVPFDLSWDNVILKDTAVESLNRVLPDGGSFVTPATVSIEIEVLAFNGDAFDLAQTSPVTDNTANTAQLTILESNVSPFYNDYGSGQQVAAVVVRTVAYVDLNGQRRVGATMTSTLLGVSPISSTRKLQSLRCPIVPKELCPGIDDLPPCPNTAFRAIEQVAFSPDEACTWGDPGIGCRIFHNGSSGCFRADSNSGPAGQQCCYASSGALLTDPNEGAGTADCVAGSGTMVKKVLHFLLDVHPFLTCCFPLLGDCEEYYNQRPSDDGSRYVPPRPPSRTFGDPHFQTLDGVAYDFNGAGEYVAFCASTTSSQLTNSLATCEPSISRLGVGRNALSVNLRFAPITGGVGRGTITVGVAIEDPLHRGGESAIAIVLHPTRRIDIFDGTTLVAFPPVPGDTATVVLATGMTLSRSTDLTAEAIKVTVVTPSGLLLKITETGGVMLPSLIVPRSVTNDVGLFGLVDDDPSNDFTNSNGEVVDVSDAATPGQETEILFNEFGLSWMIESNDASLFQALAGSSQGFIQFYDPSYVPDFEPPTVSQTLQQQADQACSGIANEAIRSGCIFDIVASGDVQLFSTTANQAVEVETTVQVLTNSPPYFAGPANEEQTVSAGNEQAIFAVNGLDDDTSELTMLMIRNDDSLFTFQVLGLKEGQVTFQGSATPGTYNAWVDVSDGFNSVLFTATAIVESEAASSAPTSETPTSEVPTRSPVAPPASGPTDITVCLTRVASCQCNGVYQGKVKSCVVREAKQRCTLPRSKKRKQSYFKSLFAQHWVNSKCVCNGLPGRSCQLVCVGENRCRPKCKKIRAAKIRQCDRKCNNVQCRRRCRKKPASINACVVRCSKKGPCLGRCNSQRRRICRVN